MNPDKRILDRSRASHLIEERLREEHCIVCGQLASHIVTEVVSGLTPFPVLASVLCCEHFKFAVGDCSTYSYGVPAQRC
jgi:hypothetical protein